MSPTWRSPSRSAATIRRRVGSAEVSNASECTMMHMHKCAFIGRQATRSGSQDLRLDLFTNPLYSRGHERFGASPRPSPSDLRGFGAGSLGLSDHLPEPRAQRTGLDDFSASS